MQGRSLSTACCLVQGLEAHINCLAVHPSRPHLAATGAQSGAVAVWDLRFAARPTCHVTPQPNAGEVWEVCAHADLYRIPQLRWTLAGLLDQADRHSPHAMALV